MVPRSLRSTLVCRLVLGVSMVCLVPRADAIIGGADAARDDFPWIAGIVSQDPRAPGFLAGGALVGDQWVATAAHAVEGLPPSALEVWLGVTDLQDPARTSLKVLAVYLHPGYAAAEGRSTHDVALLLLEGRASGIPPVGLLEDPLELVPGRPARVAGWGTSTAGLTVPTSRLQMAPAILLDEATAELSFGPFLGPAHLPAVDPAGLATPCYGDSGGPLVMEISGKDLLVGLVSFGSVDCLDASFPTVYSNLPLFSSWMGEHLGLTATPPRPVLRGKGRRVSPSTRPELRNGTDLGRKLRAGRVRRQSFHLSNAGGGWLTVPEVHLAGRGFTVLRTPTQILPAGAVSAIQIRFKVPRSGRRFRARLRLSTNDPAQPTLMVRLAARKG